MASFKMDCCVIFSYLLSVFLTVCAKEYVPVVLWESPISGGPEASASALSRMSSEDFGDVMVRRVAHSHPVVVVFSENNLSTEDFSRQNVGAQYSFPAMREVTKGTNMLFLPAVKSPGEALNRLDKQGYKWEQVLNETLPAGGKKVLVVPLDDVKPREDRVNMLVRHDKYIASLFKNMVEKYTHVLAMYTGQHSSWTTPESSLARTRRDAGPAASKPASCTTLLRSDGDSDQIMLYSSDCPILKMNDKTYVLSSGDVTPPDTRKGSHRLAVMYRLNGTEADNVKLRFRFNFSNDGYWNLTQVEVEPSIKAGPTEQTILETSARLVAPKEFSYSCTSGVVFRDPKSNYELIFTDLQVQPGVKEKRFSPAISCVQFFTAPILAGLLVTFLLLFIIAWGIDMMMNIHTMDRFDDPKGKQLFINAQE